MDARMNTREQTKPRTCMECSSAGGLPPDVWENIRDFMRMKEWARVSGTCRCMWNLPLSLVDISKSTTPEGIQWAAKRWHSADELVFRGDRYLLQTLARHLPWGGTDLASVQLVVVDTFDGHTAYEACPTYMGFLFYLLGRLSGVRSLELHIHSMRSLPPLSALTELVIHFATPDDADVDVLEVERDSLSSLLLCLDDMKGLQRLVLDASPWSSIHGWVDRWAPSLLFATLPNLTSLVLHCFVPEGVATLPHACELDLRLCQSASLEESKWRPVLRNLRHLSVQDEDMGIANVPDLLCQDLPILESVRVSAATIGSSSAYFFPMHALMHVKTLQLVASQIWLHIPANAAWEDVRLEAVGVLAITFEDVTRFVRQSGRIEICYTFASGLFMADLICELRKQGLHWNAVQCNGRTTLTSHDAEGDKIG